MRMQWLTSLTNEHTRRAFGADVEEFMEFAGMSDALLPLARPVQVQRWTEQLQRRGLAGSTIQRKLSALSSLFRYLADRGVMPGNPVAGLERPECCRPALKTLSRDEVRRLLDLPQGDELKEKRDRALLSLLFYHGLRRAQVVGLNVSSLRGRLLDVGTVTVRLQGRTRQLIVDYLKASGHRTGALFRRVRRGVSEPQGRLSPEGVYITVRAYGRRLGIQIRPRTARVTAAANALGNGADLREVQEWLGHANISSTLWYDPPRPPGQARCKVRY